MNDAAASRLSVQVRGAGTPLLAGPIALPVAVPPPRRIVAAVSDFGFRAPPMDHLAFGAVFSAEALIRLAANESGTPARTGNE